MALKCYRLGAAVQQPIIMSFISKILVLMLLLFSSEQSMAQTGPGNMYAYELCYNLTFNKVGANYSYGPSVFTTTCRTAPPIGTCVGTKDGSGSLMGKKVAMCPCMNFSRCQEEDRYFLNGYEIRGGVTTLLDGVKYNCSWLFDSTMSTCLDQPDPVFFYSLSPFTSEFSSSVLLRMRNWFTPAGNLTNGIKVFNMRFRDVPYQAIESNGNLSLCQTYWNLTRAPHLCEPLAYYSPIHCSIGRSTGAGMPICQVEGKKITTTYAQTVTTARVNYSVPDTGLSLAGYRVVVPRPSPRKVEDLSVSEVAMYSVKIIEDRSHCDYEYYNCTIFSNGDLILENPVMIEKEESEVSVTSNGEGSFICKSKDRSTKSDDQCHNICLTSGENLCDGDLLFKGSFGPGALSICYCEWHARLKTIPTRYFTNSDNLLIPPSRCFKMDSMKICGAFKTRSLLGAIANSKLSKGVLTRDIVCRPSQSGAIDCGEAECMWEASYSKVHITGRSGERIVIERDGRERLSDIPIRLNLWCAREINGNFRNVKPEHHDSKRGRLDLIIPAENVCSLTGSAFSSSDCLVRSSIMAYGSTMLSEFILAYLILMTVLIGLKLIILMFRTIKYRCSKVPMISDVREELCGTSSVMYRRDALKYAEKMLEDRNCFYRICNSKSYYRKEFLRCVASILLLDTDNSEQQIKKEIVVLSVKCKSVEKSGGSIFDIHRLLKESNLSAVIFAESAISDMMDVDSSAGVSSLIGMVADVGRVTKNTIVRVASAASGKFNNARSHSASSKKESNEPYRKLDFAELGEDEEVRSISEYGAGQKKNKNAGAARIPQVVFKPVSPLPPIKNRPESGLSRAYVPIFIILLSLPLVLSRSCSGDSIYVDNESCRETVPGVLNCTMKLSVSMVIDNVGDDACFSLYNRTSKQTIGNITVSYKSLTRVWDLSNLYYTGDYKYTQYKNNFCGSTLGRCGECSTSKGLLNPWGFYYDDVDYVRPAYSTCTSYFVTAFYCYYQHHCQGIGVAVDTSQSTHHGWVKQPIRGEAVSEIEMTVSSDISKFSSVMKVIGVGSGSSESATVSVHGVSNLPVVNLSPKKLFVDNMGEAYITPVCEVNNPVVGSIGDIQSRDELSFKTPRKIGINNTILKYDFRSDYRISDQQVELRAVRDHSSAVTIEPGITSLQSRMEFDHLPNVIGGNMFTYDKESNTLIEKIGGSRPIQMTMHVVGSLEVKKVENQCDPVMTFKSISGCHSCLSPGAVVTLETKSANGFDCNLILKSETAGLYCRSSCRFLSNRISEENVTCFSTSEEVDNVLFTDYPVKTSVRVTGKLVSDSVLSTIDSRKMNGTAATEDWGQWGDWFNFNIWDWNWKMWTLSSTTVILIIILIPVLTMLSSKFSKMFLTTVPFAGHPLAKLGSRMRNRVLETANEIRRDNSSDLVDRKALQLSDGEIYSTRKEV